MAYLDPKRVKYIVVHVTATSLKYRLTKASLLRMHRARGFSDIGYHEVMSHEKWTGTGPIKWFKGRPANRSGAHVAGFNSVSYGISMEGGFKTPDATPRMMKALEIKLRELVKKFPNAKICGHRDFSPDLDGDGLIEPHEHIKMCPWFDVIPWARERGLPAANIRGNWSEPKRKTIGSDNAAPDKRDMWLQKLLQRLGYQIVADGIVGPKTKATIEQYQTDNELKVTGKFDKETVALLRSQNKAAQKPKRKIPPPPPKEVKKALEGLDKPDWKSKTITMGRIQQLASAAGPAVTVYSDLHWGWKVAAVVVGVALFVLAVKVISDRRLRKSVVGWVDEVKSDVDSLGV